MRVRPMRLNATQKVVLAVAVAVLLPLLWFPPWREAAEREVAYRKDIGRGFILRPPAPEPVDCYFVGCKTAPASYFHVLLYRDLLFEQAGTVAGIALLLLWMFRIRRDGTSGSLRSRRTRLLFGMVMALPIPPDGTFPFASLLLDIPRQLVNRDELWLIPTVMVIFLYAACVLVIYALVSAVI